MIIRSSKFKASPKAQKGQATAAFVILLVIMLMIAGFAVDTGNYYLAIQKLKKATDAGALAGTTLLKIKPIEHTPEEVQAFVQDMVTANFPGSSLWVNPEVQVTITSAVSPYQVDIAATCDVKTLLFRMIMIDTMKARVASQAVSSTTSEAKLTL